ncbi:hypothetical protein Tco_1502797 [Tanacetum coccineum]
MMSRPKRKERKGEQAACLLRCRANPLGYKPSRDFTRPLGLPSGLKGLLHTLNATVIPTKLYTLCGARMIFKLQESIPNQTSWMLYSLSFLCALCFVNLFVHLHGKRNPRRTLEDYSKPSHKGYRNTIEIPDGNNVVPLRFDTIRLVQNGCSFHGLRFEDPNQHLKAFLKLVDSLDLNGDNKERTRMRLFQFSFEIKLAISLSVSPWDPSLLGRISLIVSLLNSFHREGLLNFITISCCSNNTKDAISLTGKSGDLCGLTSNTMRQLPLEPSYQKEFEGLVTNFILDQEEKVRQLEEYMCVIGIDFMQLSSEVVEKLKEEIRVKQNKLTKIKKFTSVNEPEPQRLPNLSPLNVNLGDKRGTAPPIKPHSRDSFRMEVVDKSTINTPPSPHVASFYPKDMYCYYHPCIDDLKKHYGFKPGLLKQSGSLGVDFSNMEMIENDWELESKEVSFLGKGLNSPVRPKEVEKVIFDKEKPRSS